MRVRPRLFWEESGRLREPTRTGAASSLGCSVEALPQEFGRRPAAGSVAHLAGKQRGPV